MKKRLNQIDVIRVNGKDGREYLVTLERLKNSTYGAPRYKGVVIPLEKGKSLYNAVYTFTGHYFSVWQEAENLVEEYIDEMLHMQERN